MVQEIEIKSLLTKEKYEELKKVLPERFKKIDEDSITTIKFKPKDIRVRYSDKVKELIFKDGDPTQFSRKEISIDLGSLENCEKMITLLTALGLEQHPSWIKHGEEFICEHAGFKYALSLQHIENFAYILEAEFMSEEHDEQHVNNIKQILQDLGCDPINVEEFKEKIKEYIEKFSSNN